MEKDFNSVFEYIRNDRMGIVRSEEFPNLRRTYSRLYEKETHFIYELLQNAEDTKATSVTFIVTNDCLYFKHNGTKQFDNDDIKAITGLGNPHKLEQEGMAGKFGIGFKSVFAYTDTPQIYTDKFAFEIQDMIVPYLIENKTVKYRNKGETLFVFPFIDKRKDKETIRTEIEDGLKSIQKETLLFLDNIKEICYELSDNRGGYVLSDVSIIDEGMIVKHLSSIFDGKEDVGSLSYLVFNDFASINTTNEDGENVVKKCRINLAFALQQKNDKYYATEIDGQVSVFFIADYALSNLKFHVNAPFACPPTRDVINVDAPENKELVQALASLSQKAILAMVEKGYFDSSSFSVFPLVRDNVQNLFVPIKDALIEVFNNECICPTDDGFKYKKQVISSNEDFKKLINIEEIRQLYSQEVFYMLNPPTRGYQFITENCTKVVNFENLLRKFSITEVNKIGMFFANKSNDWYSKTYSSFGEALRKIVKLNQAINPKYDDNYYDEISVLPKIKNQLSKSSIIKTASNKMVCPPFARFVDDLNLPNNLFPVDKNVYENDTTGNSRWFLEQIGVKVFDFYEIKKIQEQNETQELINLLDKFDLEDAPIPIIKKVLSFIKKPGNKYKINFNEYRFIFDENDELVSPQDIYIDSPYCKTGFADLKSIHGKTALNNIYKNELDNDSCAELIDFLFENDSLGWLTIDHLDYISNNPNKYILNLWGNCQRKTVTKASDWQIKDFHSYSKLHSKGFAYNVWGLISNELDKNKLIAYNYIQQTYHNESESTLLYWLTNDDWIPTKSGEFKKPCDVSPDELLDDFVLNWESVFYKPMELFKKYDDKVKALDADYKTQCDAAEKLGISLNDAEQLRKWKEDGFDAQKAYEEFRKKRGIDDISDVSNDPDKRAEAVGEETENAPEKIHGTVSTSVRLSPQDNASISSNLKQYYFDEENDKMYCQICGKCMPFKKKNGEYYFEKKELDVKKNGCHKFKETRYHYIACCPTCAAMFNEYISNSKNEEEMHKLILKILQKETETDEKTKNESVTINMEGKDYKVTFTNKHIYDIRHSIVGNSIVEK